MNSARKNAPKSALLQDETGETDDSVFGIPGICTIHNSMSTVIEEEEGEGEGEEEGNEEGEDSEESRGNRPGTALWHGAPALKNGLSGALTAPFFTSKILLQSLSICRENSIIMSYQLLFYFI